MATRPTKKSKQSPPSDITVIDYNATGHWSVEQVRSRYAQYVKKYHIEAPLDLSPRLHTEGNRRWLYPIMESVIAGIEAGDRACAELGIEFIEQDQRFTFGRILKSNTARALRRSELTEGQKERIRKRIVEMLGRQYLPHEYHQYAKLGRKIGLRDWMSRIEEQADNPSAKRYYTYFKEQANH